MGALKFVRRQLPEINAGCRGVDSEYSSVHPKSKHTSPTASTETLLGKLAQPPHITMTHVPHLQSNLHHSNLATPSARQTEPSGRKMTGEDPRAVTPVDLPMLLQQLDEKSSGEQVEP